MAVIQQTTSPSFSDKLIEWLSFFLLGIAVAYILDRYIRIRPKIFVRIEWGSKSDKDKSVGKSLRSPANLESNPSTLFEETLF